MNAKLQKEHTFGHTIKYFFFCQLGEPVQILALDEGAVRFATILNSGCVVRLTLDLRRVPTI